MGPDGVTGVGGGEAGLSGHAADSGAAAEKGERMRYLLLSLLLLVSGCVTKIESMTSNFGTVQNGKKCYTVADGDGRFNSPTFQAPPQECECDELVPVKRLVVKAGQSPEVMACPVYAKNVHATYAPSLASIYIPSTEELLGDLALGAFFYKGLTGAKPTTQVVNGSTVRTSTLLINAPVPGGVAP